MEHVFDIGMHNGDDSAYYLHKGYKVIAVEANPAMVDLARKRFRQQIEQDKLQILNVGIAAERGERPFYVSLEDPAWSSFVEEYATKGRGGGCRPIMVQCIRFKDLIDRFGTPYYAKIDIEGYDRLCLRDLNVNCTPNFVSFEMSYADANEDIDILHGLGYRRFMCIRQNDFLSMTPINVDHQCRLREIATGLGVLGKVVNKIRLRRPRDGAWRFSRGSSGMFGDDLTGAWISLDEAKAVWRKLHDIDERLSSGGLGEWFDIHVRLSA